MNFMNFRVISYILIVTGIFLLFLSLIMGNAKFGIFIIFPFVYGYGLLPAISFLIIIIGIFLFFLSPFEIKYTQLQSPNEKPEFENVRKEKHVGGVLLIGPIPIIFGNDKNMAIISILASVLILLAILIFILFLIY